MDLDDLLFAIENHAAGLETQAERLEFWDVLGQLAADAAQQTIADYGLIDYSGEWEEGI
jgi:hypothetical protein